MKSRRATLLVAMLLLTGCSSTAPSASSGAEGLEGVDVSGASTAQASEIGDNVATVDEYQAAFQRYRECLSAAGFELTDVEFTGFVYEAGVPNAAVEDGADEECYVSEFRYTDMLWQGSDAVQNNSDTAQLLRDCLQGRGIEPADTLEEMNGQLGEAGIEVSECLS